MYFVYLKEKARNQSANFPLGHHGLGHLEEACDIRADHEIAGLAALDRGVIAGLVDALHDAVQLLVDLVEAPGQAHGVLAHLQAGGGNTARVGGLAGAVQQTRALDEGNGLGRQGHVRALEDRDAAVVDEGLRALCVHLVLARAGMRDVALDVPDVLAALDIPGAGDLISVDGDTGPSLLLDVEELGQVDAVGIVDIALGWRRPCRRAG